MKVIVAEPPMIDEIDSAFGVRGKPILYAWGDRIFNPANVTVRPELMAHERVHGERQMTGAFIAGEDAETRIVKWWRRYIADQGFRLDEEIPAHKAEYETLAFQHNNAGWRRQCLNHVALRLRADLYRYQPKLALHTARRLLVPKAA